MSEGARYGRLFAKFVSMIKHLEEEYEIACQDIDVDLTTGRLSLVCDTPLEGDHRRGRYEFDSIPEPPDREWGSDSPMTQESDEGCKTGRSAPKSK